MSLDLGILSVLGRRESFERIYDTLRPQMLAEHASNVFKALPLYYSQHDVAVIDWQDFGRWYLLLKVPAHDDNATNAYSALFQRLSDFVVDPRDDAVAALIARDYASQIADAAMAVLDNKANSLTKINDLLEAYEHALGRQSSASTTVVCDSVDLLISNTAKVNGLKWRLKFLNESLGQIQRGDFLAFAARPEAGKTTLLAAESTYMAAQLPNDKHIVWFNNEELGSKVKLRCVQSALGATRAQLLAGPKEAAKRYAEAVGHPDKIIVVDAVTSTARDIMRILKQYPPGLIIFDQLSKLHGFDGRDRSDVQTLKAIYQWARELAKQYAPIITVHQARGDSEGVLYPEANQMEGSQTGVQGELDVQVMIGRSHDPGYEYVRGFNIVKNKLSGGDDSKRHGKFEAKIFPLIARYGEVT